MKALLRRFLWGGRLLHADEISIITEAAAVVQGGGSLIRQISNVEFVQVFHGGRMIHVYFKKGYKEDKLDLIGVICIAEVEWMTDECSGRCRLVLNDGLMSSIEFSLSPKGGGFVVLRAIPRIAAYNDVLAMRIDAIEHENSG